MRRLVPVLITATMLLTACGNAELSPGEPVCLHGEDDVGVSVIIQFQAVPHARWGPCLETLRSGWEFGGQSFRNGRAGFWLNSDQLGDRFLKVELYDLCPSGDGEYRPPPAPGVNRTAIVFEEPAPLSVIVIPETPQQSQYAEFVASELTGRVVAGHPVEVGFDRSSRPVADRVGETLASGSTALVVDSLSLAEQVVIVHRPGRPARRLELEQVVHAIGDHVPEAAYRAEWKDSFEGGCITYQFDAKGDEAHTVADDAFGILGFNDYVRLRALADQAGYGY